MVAAIATVALGLRLFHAWYFNQANPGGASVLHGDEGGYDYLAREIMAGRRLIWPGRVPLYSLWLALVYSVSGGSYDFARYAQAILGTTTVVLTYVLGRRVFGHWPGVLAAGLAALSYFLSEHALHILSEVVFTPVLLVVMIALHDAFQRPDGLLRHQYSNW